MANSEDTDYTMEALEADFLGDNPSTWHSAHFSNPEQGMPFENLVCKGSELSDLLKSHLQNGKGTSAERDRIDSLYKDSDFPKTYYRLFFVLYAPGHKRIVVSRSFSKGRWRFSKVFARLLKHPRRHLLTEGDFSLQIDFIESKPYPVNFYKIGMTRRGSLHFEIGLDGLSFHGEDEKPIFFLPGDAYVRSIMSMKQLRDHLTKIYGETYLRNASFSRFRSTSILISENRISQLYRGIPTVGSLTKDKIESAVHLAVEHIKHTQESDGKFLYYYDPVLDSKKDFEHPRRDLKRNPYYNILRHSGGGLTCIYHEKYTEKSDTINNMRMAIEYLLAHAKFYTLNGKQAAYIYSEKKAKLGGAGIGLYFLAEYQLLTGDTKYQDFADAVAWHTLNQIMDSGEFLYYNIYLDEVVTPADNDKYFSFYYPGEAICGLAKYLHLVDPDDRQQFFDKMKQALEFLIMVRPVERAGEYTKIPSDSWLMMGVMELWDFEEMRDSRYANFVFSDARKMVEQMYKVTDAPYPDYAGAFYYEFGDYPYADGARLEGLLGAYELACKMNNVNIRRCLWKSLRLGAWAVAHMVNTKEAIYCAKRPEIALGGIRFKYTRQWFRIDTIQHVACFYAKLLPYWDEAEVDAGNA
jgi:hypothetical protein